MYLKELADQLPHFPGRGVCLAAATVQNITAEHVWSLDFIL